MTDPLSRSGAPALTRRLLVAVFVAILTFPAAIAGAGTGEPAPVAPSADFTLTASTPCVAASCEPRVAYATDPVAGGVLVEVDWDLPGGDSAAFQADDSLQCADSTAPAGAATTPFCDLYGPPYSSPGTKVVALRVTGPGGLSAVNVASLTVAPQPVKRGPHRRQTAADPCPPYERGVHCGPGNNRRMSGGHGKVSHRGWPAVSGMFWIVQDRHGHKVTGIRFNDELLGAHGSDRIAGGPGKDIIWGDYHPCCQPARQHDVLSGGPGADWIYSSHGHNDIWTGTGADRVFIHWGHGTVHCGSPRATVLGRPRHPNYRLIGCKRIKVW